MIFIICGSIVGVVMGLTGSGGALISIPLFMQFLNMPLKEASVLSLFVVTIGSFSNFLNFKKFTDYKLGLLLVSASALGSYISAPFKKNLPDYVIGILLSIVSIFALYNVWKPTSVEKKDVQAPGLFPSLLLGLILGGLSTFTGIGGGVLIIPVLLSFYSFNQNKALATSLLTVGLSSLVSFLIQNIKESIVEINIELIYLVLGTIFAAYGLKFITKKWSEKILSMVRKVTFSLVVIISLLKIYLF